ncbi:DUF1593 domain-containing protein [Micromonospora sp. WMMC241]|uniref:nucleoside hydrolase-like domain-containing protein n=1 Tax=Micromonospora sp. WMMC241 TaxID=3015159 RepID=UPI0022B64A67|nr:nucleoside hydrolase-like domain-containing protein [Micromonospora sp. WMMC241]MCZ7436712.1 DUF1593 domain-containing protein [Micromonospora sp. WMMC241]
MDPVVQPARARQRLRRSAAAAAALVTASGMAVGIATQAHAAAGCRVGYTVTNQWEGGFGANIAITNLGDPVSSWTLTFSFAAGQKISQLWNGNVTQSGGSVTVTNLSYNGALGTNATVTPGFNGTWSGTNPAPSTFRLNGVTCTGSTGPGPTPTTPTTPSPTPTTPAPTPTPSSPTPTPTPSPTGSAGVKPRVINMTDLGADPDDLESLVRMLVTANEVDLEGIIATTSCWKPTQDATNMANLLNPRLNAYGQVLPNLQKHAQGYPTLAQLQSISKLGQKGYGMGDVGAGKDSPGSELIIAAVDRNDARPVWVNFWGGGNTLAQALWKVKNTRGQAQVDQFVSKLRVYDVLGQDEAGAWMTKTFPNLFYIRAKNLVYNWQPSDSWVDNNVQNHGPLGAQYPDRIWAFEGDSPSFLYQLPNGLTDPQHADWGSWGGRFDPVKKAGVRGMTESGRLGAEPSYDPYYMYSDASEGGSSTSRWSTAINNDFAARMDWTVNGAYSGANHQPAAVLNGDTTKQVLQFSAAAGSTVNLSAAGSSDPDRNSLSYSWTYYDEPSSYNGAVTINNSTSSTATVQIPANAGGKSLHIILEIRDNGAPTLYSYRRAVINVR